MCRPSLAAPDRRDDSHQHQRRNRVGRRNRVLSLTAPSSAMTIVAPTKREGKTMGKLSYPGERQLLAAEQKERERERIAKSGT